MQINLKEHNNTDIKARIHKQLKADSPEVIA